MDPQERLSMVVSDEISNTLIAHKEKEREHVEALLASQKHLTSNVRTLINSLDQVAMLSAPKFNSSQPDVLKSAVSRARLLQKHLDAIRARMQRIQVHLQGHKTVCPAPGNQPTELQQQQQQQQHVQELQQADVLPTQTQRPP